MIANFMASVFSRACGWRQLKWNATAVSVVNGSITGRGYPLSAFRYPQSRMR
jgi:hypothetical protein